jgi:hypothetical protein
MIILITMIKLTKKRLSGNAVDAWNFFLYAVGSYRVPASAA